MQIFYRLAIIFLCKHLMRNQGLCSANSKQILIWKHLYLSHCYNCGKNTPLAFDTIEILNKIIFYASFGASAIMLTSLCGQFFPDLLTFSNWEEIYSSFSQSDSKLRKNWRRKVQFFLDLFDWGECSISSSCWGDGGEERFLCPGDSRDRSSMSWRSKVKQINWSNHLVETCKLGSTTGALRGLERLSLSRPSPSPW